MEDPNSCQLESSGEAQELKGTSVSVKIPEQSKNNGQITQGPTVPDVPQQIEKQSNITSTGASFEASAIQQARETLQDLVRRNKALEVELNTVLDNERFCMMEDRVKLLREQLLPLQKAIQARENQASAQAKMLKGSVQLSHRMDQQLEQMQNRFQDLGREIGQTEQKLRTIKDREDAFVELIPGYFYTLASPAQDKKQEVKRLVEVLTKLKGQMTKELSGREETLRSLEQTQTTIDDLDLLRQDYGALARQEQREFDVQIRALQKQKYTEEAALLKLRGDYDLLLQQFERKLGGDCCSSESFE